MKMRNCPPQTISKLKLLIRPGNSGGFWEPISKKVFGFPSNSRTFCPKVLICYEFCNLFS